MRLLIATVLLGGAGGLVADGPSGPARKADGPEGDRGGTVVVPVDNGPVNGPVRVRRTDMIRVIGTPIAGATLDVAVDGPAELVARNSVVQRDKTDAKIAMPKTEFNIRPTGPGRVTVTVRVSGPTVPEPAETRYLLDVR